MELWELQVREAVRDTIARYLHGGDRARLDELASTFAVDGELLIDDEPPVRGRAAIVERLSSVPAAPGSDGTRLLHHHVSSVRFLSVTREKVEAASYFLAVTERGPDHWGRYRDVLVPDGDAWVFARRTVTVSGSAPESRFAR